MSMRACGALRAMRSTTASPAGPAPTMAIDRGMFASGEADVFVIRRQAVDAALWTGVEGDQFCLPRPAAQNVRFCRTIVHTRHPSRSGELLSAMSRHWRERD